MKNLGQAPVIFLLAALMVSPGIFAAGLNEGGLAPVFSTTTLAGKAVDSQGLRGKVVMLHFWATWCTPCREEMPLLERFYGAHHGDGLEIIALSADDEGDVAKVREFTKDFSYPVGLTAASHTEGFGRLWVLPLTFVIDRRGVLRKTDWTGKEKIDAASLNKIVLPLLNEK